MPSANARGSMEADVGMGPGCPERANDLQHDDSSVPARPDVGEPVLAAPRWTPSRAGRPPMPDGSGNGRATRLRRPPPGGVASAGWTRHMFADEYGPACVAPGACRGGA